MIELLFNSFIVAPLELYRKYGLLWAVPVVSTITFVILGFGLWYHSFNRNYDVTSRGSDRAINDADFTQKR